MRYEGLSSERKNKVPEVIRTGTEQGELMRKLTEYGQALSEMVTRAFEKTGVALLGTNPENLDIDLTQDRPTETNTGRGYTPERDMPEARARAAVAETKKRLGAANGKMVRILAYAAALTAGAAYMVPAAEKAGEVRGAIDAARNDPANRDSIGRFVRNVTDVAKDAADTVSREIEERTQEQASRERSTRTNPEASLLARQRAFNTAIKVHADEFAKELFHQWLAEAGKDGRHHRTSYEFFASDAIAALAKQHPDFQQFRDVNVGVTPDTQSLVRVRANEIERNYIAHSFRNLRSGTRLQDVQKILDRVGWTNDSIRGTASAMLIEAGHTNLGMQLLRQTIRNSRMEDGELLSLDADAPHTEEGPEEQTMRSRIADSIITPFLEQNPERILLALEGQGRSPRLRLSREEMDLFLQAAEDLADETEYDAQIMGRDLPVQTPAREPSLTEVAQINEHQESLKEAKKFEAIHQRLLAMADPQTRARYSGNGGVQVVERRR